MDQSSPLLAEIIAVVNPRLVLLTRVWMSELTNRFASNVTPRADAERDPGVKQIVFAACSALLRPTGKPTLVVQLAPASQFGWTYKRYQVADRIRGIMV